MADTQETIADIIAEMRRRIAVKMSDAWYTQEEWRKLCDRLEAAWKREMSKNASKNGVDFGQLGDCAKLREATIETRSVVAKCLDILNEIPDECGYGGLIDDVADELCGLREEYVNAALAAPPRNCDRFATADEAFHAWNNTTDTPGGGAYVGLIGWLFAPATEKEGGNDAD